MIKWLRLPLAALTLAMLLGGCEAHPAGPGTASDSHAAPYYGDTYIGVGAGLHVGGGLHH